MVNTLQARNLFGLVGVTFPVTCAVANYDVDFAHGAALFNCDTPVISSQPRVQGRKGNPVNTIHGFYSFRAQTAFPVDPDSYTVVARGVADLYPL